MGILELLGLRQIPLMQMLKQDPPSKEYPTSLMESLINDLSYGDPVASYVTPGKAKVREVELDEVKRWNDEPVQGGKARLTNTEDSERIHRAWLAARRNPVSQLGYDPLNMIETPMRKDDRKLNVMGLYDPRTNQSWYDTTNESSSIHESMHRGIAKLRKAGLLPEKLPKEEYVVRALMRRILGDIEMGRGAAGDEQVKTAKHIDQKYMHSDTLDELERIAAQFIADKRPMGPR